MTGAVVQPGRDDGAPTEVDADPSTTTAIHGTRLTRSWPVDLIMAAAVLGTLGFLLAVTGDSWFFADEWNAGLRGRSLRDFLQPYNGHLSVTWIATYRGFYGLFGFHHHWILRLLAFAALTTVSGLLYATTRSRVGPTLAALAAVILLWTPGTALDPGSMNHWFAGCLTVVLAWALPRSGRRSDAVVLAALALALATSGGGVAAGAACVVHTIVAPSSGRRRLAVALPLVAWTAWWLRWGRSGPELDQRLRMDLVDVPTFVRDGLYGTIQDVGGGTTAAAVIVLLAATALIVTRLRARDRLALASLLAWGAAAAIWWAGIGWNRGLFSDAGAYRYQLVTALYLLLAAIWSTPPDWRPPAVLRPGRGSVVVAVVLVALVAMRHDRVRDEADGLGDVGRSTRTAVLVIGSRPSVVPPAAAYGIQFGYLTQAELEEVLRAYDVPGEGSRESLDQRLVAAGAVEAVVGPAPGPRCRPIDAAISLPSGTAPPPVVLGARSAPVRVTAVRYGRRATDVITVPAGRTVQLRFAADMAERPWTVRATGGCRVG